MYAVQPVAGLPEKIPLPTVMYELPKILDESCGDVSSSSSSSDQCPGLHRAPANVGRQTVSPKIDFMEARQTEILKEVFQLKNFFDQLSIGIRLGDPKVPLEPLKLKEEIVQGKVGFTNKCHGSSQKQINEEIIINANPANPPYFILALQRIWKDAQFNISLHTNSCYGNVTNNSSFEEKLQTTSKNDAVHHINLTLIWKNVKEVQLITKVYDFPLEGEANVLRYLTRLIEKYNYEQLPAEVSNSIDVVLDLCLRLPFEEARYKNAIIVKLSHYLETNQWLLNSTDPSIVDAVAWSVLKREESKIPSELKVWFDLCEKTFLSV